MAYLAGGERLDAPQQLRDILDGHLEAEGVPPEQHGGGLLQQAPASAALAQHHLLVTHKTRLMASAGETLERIVTFQADSEKLSQNFML